MNKIIFLIFLFFSQLALSTETEAPSLKFCKSNLTGCRQVYKELLDKYVTNIEQLNITLEMYKDKENAIDNKYLEMKSLVKALDNIKVLDKTHKHNEQIASKNEKIQSLQNTLKNIREEIKLDEAIKTQNNIKSLHVEIDTSKKTSAENDIKILKSLINKIESRTDIEDVVDEDYSEEIRKIIVKLQDSHIAPRIYYLSYKLNKITDLYENFEVEVEMITKRPDNMNNVKTVALWVGEDAKPFISFSNPNIVEGWNIPKKNGASYLWNLKFLQEGEHKLTIGEEHHGPLLKEIIINAKMQSGFLNYMAAWGENIVYKVSENLLKWVAILALVISNIVVLLDFIKRVKGSSNK